MTLKSAIYIALSVSSLLTTSASAIPIVFTNAGAQGISGPTQALVDAAYSSTNLAGQVTVSPTGIQRWTVQQSGRYSVTASGASGGSTTNATGGRGAMITTEINLNVGDIINVLVGQIGGLATFSGGGNNSAETGGGGGGTFIVGSSNTPLLIAGGGGGAAEGLFGNNYIANGVDASAYNQTAGQNGVSTAVSWSPAGIGGTDGNGGIKPGYGGAGGGGFLTDGQGGNRYSGEGGMSYLNGGFGGLNVMYTNNPLINIEGGFGGGAGAGTHSSFESNAGGGGGYSGGGGGGTRVGAGGGGGNYYAGNFISSGYNVGNGWASFELLNVASVPEPGILALLSLGLIATGFTRRKV